MFEDSGWQHVGGSMSSGLQYFEQIGTDSGEDIFSDRVSKAERNKRVANLLLGLAAVYLPVLFAFYLTGLFKLPRISSWKELYYTPGLWEKTGLDFVGAFLFETPFVLMRNFAGFLSLLIVLLWLYFGISALYWYYKEKK